MTHKKGTIEMIAGLLLFAAALLLVAYNLWESKNAGNASASALTQLVQAMPEEKNRDMAEKLPDGSNQSMDPPGEIEYPDYILNPQMDMPVKNIEGYDFVALLDIPAIGINLPILSEYVYKNLQHSPCRYQGSAYLDNLVICAHNYESHFGGLKNLSSGDRLTLTDMDGNVFLYEVREIIVLNPYDIEEFTESGYALTLFTCTVGGASRVAVRCDKLTD